MNKEVLGIDAWRLVVLVQTVALTVHAAPPDGYGGRLLALGGLALVAVMTVAMAARRAQLPRWLRGWALLAAGFSAFATASSLWSLAPRVSFEDAVTTTVMLAFLVLTAATRWQDRSTLYRDLAFVFAVAVVLQATALVAGALGVDTVYDPDYGRFRGWFSNANYAGIMSAVGLSVGIGSLYAARAGRAPGDDPVAVDAGGRGPGRSLPSQWVLVGCVLLWAGLVLAQSRGAMLALGLSVVVLVMPRLGLRKSLALVGVALATGAAVVVLNGLTNEPPGADLPTTTGSDGGSKRSPSFDPITRDAETDVTSGRLGIYQELAVTVRDNPFEGTGYRTTELNPELDGSAGHNIYLSTFAETGVLGGLLFVALLAVPVLRALSDYSLRLGAPAATGAVMVALSEMFESSILGWGSPTTLLAWTVVLAGACAASGRRVEQDAGVLG